MTGLVVPREKVIRPPLAAGCQRERQSRTLLNPTLIHRHYESRRTGMRDPLTALGSSVNIDNKFSSLG